MTTEPTTEQLRTFASEVASELDRIIAAARKLCIDQIEDIEGSEEQVALAMKAREEKPEFHSEALIGTFICKLYQTAGFSKGSSIGHLLTLSQMLVAELADDYDELSSAAQELSTAIRKRMNEAAEDGECDVY
jgi:hypothetical protein